MKTKLTLISLFIGCASIHGQFGVRFGDESFTAKGYQAVYSFESGQLLMLTDTPEARQEGYIFVDSNSGAKLSSFLLDSRHGGLLTPDGSELLIGGAEGSIRTMGRYEPATLEPIANVGINLGDNLFETIGIGGNFEPTPDGGFIFGGTDINASVNFIAKYNREFEELWSTSFTFEGSFSIAGVETFPLPNGDVGFFVFFNQPGEVPGQIDIVDVFGLLDGESGELAWTFTYRPPLGSINNRIEDFQYTFGSDGSFFGHAAAQIDVSNITAPVDRSVAKIVRITPDGDIAYSKSLTVSDAVILGADYMDGPALLHGSFNDEDSTQFVAVDASGNITGSTAVNNHLSAGDGDLTATRRSGSNTAFVRATFSPGGEILASFDLTSGEMEFRGLPLPIPGNPNYEAIGSFTAYPVAPFNSPGGHSAVSRVLAAEIFGTFGANPQMELIELPSDGSFPPCIAYSNASISFIDPQPTSTTDIEFINLDEGWSTAAYSGFGGFGDLSSEPELEPMDVTVTETCEDDGGAGGPLLSITKTGPSTAELSFETTADVSYTIQRADALESGDSFANMQVVAGDGAVFTTEIQIGADQEYFRVVVN